MSISFRDVEEILRIIDEFPVAEIRFEHNDLKLYVRRDNGAAPASSSSTSAPAIAAPAQAPATHEVPVTTATPVPVAAKSKGDAEARERDGQVAIAAPVSGTFYSSPSPDAPPFISVGQVIEQGTDLFIIEVMKLMNFVKAPISGTIMSIEVENAEPVQQEQCTMWIQPSRG